MRILLIVLFFAACNKPRFSESDHTITVDGVKVADVHETVRARGRGGEQIQRNITLVKEPKDTVLELAETDEEGFAVAASYRREGAKGKRYVELRGKEIFSRGNDETISLPDKPIVSWSLKHRLKAKGPRDVTVVDLQHAFVSAGKLDANGALTVEPPPQPTREDPVKPEHTQATPFFESGAPQVVSWCKMQGAAMPPVDAARAVALAVKPKLADEKSGGPPAALNALALGGGDAAGAALVVACLRSLGHPARAVYGATRTWAQVHDGTRWRDVDPTLEAPVLDDGPALVGAGLEPPMRSLDVQNEK